MTKNELYALTMNLYESSKLMRNISDDCADILLQMSTQTLTLLERVNIPDELKEEIESIKSEILSDD